jgi:filamentous hemagglutinin
VVDLTGEIYLELQTVLHEPDYDPFPSGQTVEGWLKAMKEDKDSGIAYDLADTWTDYAADNQQYRAVIQAGGNVNATFTNDISNTNTTANAGKISNTIVAPASTHHPHSLWMAVRAHRR